MLCIQEKTNNRLGRPERESDETEIDAIMSLSRRLVSSSVQGCKTTLLLCSPIGSKKKNSAPLYKKDVSWLLLTVRWNQGTTITPLQQPLPNPV